MDVYEALYTTRAMRRVRPDPVPEPVQARILDAAIRAPSGGNSQGWRFLLVDDAAVKAELGPLYRDSVSKLWSTIYAERIAAAEAHPDDPDSVEMLRIQRSAQHLADHFEAVLFLFGFVKYDPTGGSIYPAVWSPAGGPGRRRRQRAHRGPRCLPSPRGHGRARGAGRPGLDHGVLRVVRVPDRALGCGPAATGRRGGVAQPVRGTARVRRRRAAVVLTPSDAGGEAGGPFPQLERRALRQVARASDSYGLLLILLGVNYVLLTAVGNPSWVLLVRAVAIAATVLLAFHTSQVRGDWLLAIRITVGVVMVLAVVATVFGDQRAEDVVTLVLGVLLAASPVAVLIRILHHERVGSETILGAICVYVLLGLFFALVDTGIAAAYGAQHPFFTETDHPTSAEFIYFSYVTLTTTGYGDFTPSSGLPQTAAVLEALMGQIFLVTLVARIVALYKPRAPRYSEAPTTETPGPIPPTPGPPTTGLQTPGPPTTGLQTPGPPTTGPPG